MDASLVVTVVFVVCTIRCLYIDVFVCFVESIVNCLLFLKFEQRKSLKTEKRSEPEKDVNSNRYKMDFMLNREYLKIINSNW